MPGGSALGCNGASAAPGNVIFLSTLCRPSVPAFAHEAWRISRAPVRRRLAGTVGLLTHHGHANISHFLADAIPRLWLLLRHDPVPDRFLIAAGAPAWRDELLAIAGIEPERCIAIADGEIIDADQLLIPEPSGFATAVAPWAAFAARSLLGGVRGEGKRRRLWISRGDAARRWRYEDDCAAELDVRGFELIRLESLSVADQLTLTRSADVIAGPHGAGLAWIVTQPGPGLLWELSSPDHAHNDYRALSHVSGWHYDRTPVRDGLSMADDPDARLAEMTVPPRDVLAMLDRALADMA